MDDVRTGGSAARSTARYLRLPLLLLTGLFTMGSGMGNPGCGGDDPGALECKDDCYVEGTWELRYAYPSRLPAECLEDGVVLPTGPLKIVRIEESVLASVGDLTLSGSYLGRQIDSSLQLSGSKSVSPGSPQYDFVYRGDLSAEPESPDTPLTWKGTLHVYPLSDPTGRCDTTLDFTAIR